MRQKTQVWWWSLLALWVLAGCSGGSSPDPLGKIEVGTPEPGQKLFLTPPMSLGPVQTLLRCTRTEPNPDPYCQLFVQVESAGPVTFQKLRFPWSEGGRSKRVVLVQSGRNCNPDCVHSSLLAVNLDLPWLQELRQAALAPISPNPTLEFELLGPGGTQSGVLEIKVLQALFLALERP